MVPPAKMASVLNSPLWKPVFRHQLSPELGLAASWPTPPHQDSKEVFTCAVFLPGTECLLIASASSVSPAIGVLTPAPPLAARRQGPSLVPVVSTLRALGASESCGRCSGTLAESLHEPVDCVSAAAEPDV